MRIGVGSDHAGFRYKSLVAQHLRALGHDVLDFGTSSEDPVDYPDYIRPVAAAVAAGTVDRGVVFGGSGNGEAMTANRVRGVRCGVAWSRESARLSRAHNDANVLSIGERLVPEDELLAIVDVWLETPFEGGRHIARIRKIDEPRGGKNAPATGPAATDEVRPGSAQSAGPGVGGAVGISVRGLCPLIQVFDMPRSLRFYRDVLGFAEVQKSGDGDDVGWAWLRQGDAGVMLNTAYDTGERPTAPDPARLAAHGDTALFLECRDLDGAYAHLVAHGVAAEPPKVAPYGMRQLYAKDPDGYELCFQWPAESQVGPGDT